MIQLDLNPEEQKVLKEVLEGCLSDLRMEISNTDLQDYRDKLKFKKGAIKKLLGVL